MIGRQNCVLQHLIRLRTYLSSGVENMFIDSYISGVFTGTLRISHFL
jgi:hypothetical protein